MKKLEFKHLLFISVLIILNVDAKVTEDECSKDTYTGIKLVNARFSPPGQDLTGRYVYNNIDCKNGLPASNAIDGFVCNQKCGSHSNKDETWPLLVDLKTPTKINHIVIYGRQDTDWGYHGSVYASLVITVDETTDCKAREKYDGDWRKKFGLETPMFYDCYRDLNKKLQKHGITKLFQ